MGHVAYVYGPCTWIVMRTAVIFMTTACATSTAAVMSYMKMSHVAHVCGSCHTWFRTCIMSMPCRISSAAQINCKISFSFQSAGSNHKRVDFWGFLYDERALRWWLVLYRVCVGVVCVSHVRMSYVTHTIEYMYVTYTNESCHTYEWVISHIRMSHVTHTSESRHTNKWVASAVSSTGDMSHIRMSHVVHTNESCHTYKCVISHERMSYVTQTNESCHTYEWVMSHMITHAYYVWTLCDIVNREKFPPKKEKKVELTVRIFHVGGMREYQLLHKKFQKFSSLFTRLHYTTREQNFSPCLCCRVLQYVAAVVTVGLTLKIFCRRFAEYGRLMKLLKSHM